MSGMPSGGERDLGSISREGRRKKRNEDVAAVRSVPFTEKCASCRSLKDETDAESSDGKFLSSLLCTLRISTKDL